MTLWGLSGTQWRRWAAECSHYLHFHLPAVRAWLPLVANWWLTVPDQEALTWREGRQWGLALPCSSKLMIDDLGIERVYFEVD